MKATKLLQKGKVHLVHNSTNTIPIQYNNTNISLSNEHPTRMEIIRITRFINPAHLHRIEGKGEGTKGYMYVWNELCNPTPPSKQNV